MTKRRVKERKITWPFALLLMVTQFSAQAWAQNDTMSVRALFAPPKIITVAPAPHSHKAAWLVNDQGRQAIYFGDAAHKTAVVSYDRDDGFPLSNLIVSPDEKFIVFIHGGGEKANPSNDPAPPERSLLLASTDHATTTRIDGGSVTDPTITPDGTHIAYVKRGEIWMADVTDLAHPKRLVAARGAQHDVTFSPDGSKFAFVSDRGIYGEGQYSFIGIYDLKTGGLSYLAPGLGNDQDPVWSPDSRKLAFLRILVPPKSYRFNDFTAGPPFSIVVGDVATGAGKPIFTADLGRGSIFSSLQNPSDYSQIHKRPNLFWTADDKIVFPWEKTGWRLLYAVAADGSGPAHALAGGDFEVSSAALSPDRKKLVITANPDARMHPRAYMLSPNSKSLDPLFPPTELQRDPVFCGDGSCILAFSWMDERPGQWMVKSKTTAEVLDATLSPDTKQTARFVHPTTFSYPSEDDFTIDAVIYRPKPVPGVKRPALVYAHGGSRQQVFPGSILANEAFVQHLVARGFIVVAINFRSGIGYGMQFRETAIYGGRSRGHGDIDDFAAVAKHLATFDDVDPKRIGIFGVSYGGYIVSNSLARHSDLFAAGASLSGVSDWVREIEDDTGKVLPFRLSARSVFEDLAYESSGISAIDTWRSPLLLVHGDGDTEGHMEADIELTTALVQRRVPVEAYIIPGETHGLTGWENKVKAYSAMADFFQRRLGTSR